MTEKNRLGSLKVNVNAGSIQYRIPKEIQVLERDLSIRFSEWIFNDEWIHTIVPGIYMIRLNLTSGLQMSKVVEVKAGQEHIIYFNVSDSEQPEQGDPSALFKASSYRHFASSRKNQIPRKDDKKGLKGIDISLVLYPSRNDRRFLETNDRYTSNITKQGRSFSLGSFEEPCIMIVEGSDTKQYVVFLPPGNNIKCFVRLVETENKSDLPFEMDISISGSNLVAQALLSLITSGDIEKAGSLFRSTEAENLLYGKISDPVSAAVGGYYLLRTQELHRIHDWANNLANWFSWMPDGAIIHAWQLILQKDLNEDAISKIRDRLVQACTRGIPIYTEGLRLLYEGLTMCSYQFKREDSDIEMLLEFVRNFIAYADMSQETSTFVFPKAGTVGIYQGHP